MYGYAIPSRTINIKGKEFLFFSGTGYLGIHCNSEFGALVKAGIDQYGTNYGASRLGKVDIPVFDQAEKKLAQFIGSSSAVVLSSGTLAGRVLLEALGNAYTFHYTPNAHVAIHPGYLKERPETFNCSIEDIIDLIHFSPLENHVITLNSVDALTATLPDMDWIQRLPKDKKITLIIDDSHAIGLLGDGGSGLYKEIKKKHPDTILIASLGKGMGLPAGVVAGADEYINKVKQHPLFGGSSPSIPAYLYAYCQADSIYEQAYLTLQSNIEYFIRHLKRINLFKFLPGYPIFSTSVHDLDPYFEHHGVKISSFSYPSPTDQKYTRIILSALHTQEDLDVLLDLIHRF